MVAVSQDGSLGWLACEMEAAGLQTGDGGEEEFTFGYTWVEFVARHEGGWKRIGNASSPRP